ncbi:MAG: prolipoprotein diacylglyceryl transferase [Ardenticatenaceae bacterium]
MDPIAFEIGPLVFRWYGLLIVGGALLAAWVASKEAEHRGQNPQHVWDAFVWALLGGIVGARLYHVLSSPAGSQTGPYYYFVEQPFTTIQVFGQSIPFPSALAIWEGGLGIYGAILGGVIVLWLYTRRHNLYLPTWLDIGAIGLVTGQVIGRWGNFFNQELYGEPTTLPWGIPIDQAHRLPEYADLPAETRFHPTFLYESLWNFLALGILLWISRRFEERLRPGDIASLYMIFYGTGRFLVEFQRPDAWRIAGLPTAQWIGIALVLLGAFLLWRRHRGPQEVPYVTRKLESRAERRRRARESRARG